MDFYFRQRERKAPFGLTFAQAKFGAYSTVVTKPMRSWTVFSVGAARSRWLAFRRTHFNSTRTIRNSWYLVRIGWMYARGKWSPACPERTSLTGCVAIGHGARDFSRHSGQSSATALPIWDF